MFVLARFRPDGEIIRTRQYFITRKECEDCRDTFHKFPMFNGVRFICVPEEGELDVPRN